MYFSRFLLAAIQLKTVALLTVLNFSQLLLSVCLLDYPIVLFLAYLNGFVESDQKECLACIWQKINDSFSVLLTIYKSTRTEQFNVVRTVFV